MYFSKQLFQSMILLLSVVLLTCGTCDAAGKGNTKTPGPGWSTPQNVDKDGGRDHYIVEPRVAMDDNGNVIVVWNENQGLNVSEYTNGAWGKPFTIPISGINTLDQYVAMSGNGDAIILWTEYIGPDSRKAEVKMIERKGGLWGEPVSISYNAPPGMGTLGVRLADNGDAVIVWREDVPWEALFMVDRRGGLWSAPINITDGYVNRAANTPDDCDIAMADNGDTVIVWRGLDNFYSGPSHIYRSEYRNGAWQHPASGADYINMPDMNGSKPRVAISNSGDAMVSWIQWQLSTNGVRSYDILVSKYRGGAWSAPASLNLDSPAISSMSLAMDNSGNATMAWYSQILASDNYGVYAYECRADVCGLVSDGNELSPNSASLHDSYNPYVAMDDSGNAVIFWSESGTTYKSEYRGGVWHHPGASDNQSVSIYETSAAGIAMSNNGTAAVIMTALTDVERWGTINYYGKGLFVSQYK